MHEDAAIDVILETVDDPIAEVSPPATAKMPVSDIKTSSNRKVSGNGKNCQSLWRWKSFSNAKVM